MLARPAASLDLCSNFCQLRRPLRRRFHETKEPG
jgi:hypothetical protein